MEPDWSKFDRGLTNIYANFLEIKNSKNLKGVWIHPVLKNDNKTVFLTMEYTGELAEVEKQGFATQAVVKENVANGLVNLEFLPELSQLPSVIRLSYGDEMSVFIDSSVEEILARGTTPGTNCVWSVDQSTAAFSGMTGENVIIGIIDTGIEWRHQNFKKHDVNETRILRIWDQGLVPVAGERSPDAALLTPGGTYGVEYTEQMINAELTAPSATPPAIRVRHRDCNGHGTHVAGIAAGNGREVRFLFDLFELPFRYVGVAPKAKIVVVKFLHLENEPPVNHIKKFKDAITYIIRIAAQHAAQQVPPLPPLPVVINCSFGSNLDPHDGLDEDATNDEQSFLESTFSAAAGKICVFAASNDSGKRHHAVITIPAGGSIEIPFELYDPRTVRNDNNKCRVEDNTKPLFLSFWYRNSVAGLTARFKPAGKPAFSAAVGIGGAPASGTFDTNKTFRVNHNSATTQRLGTPVTRNNIFVSVIPHSNLHRTGIHTVKLNGPAGAVIHVWCPQARGYGFKIDPALASSAAIQITDNNTIGQPGDTTNVITVAAYIDTNDQMACFSSKGPLVDYSGSGVISDKPDISAPGFNILSAASYQTDSAGDTFSSWFRSDYVFKGGTSMAAPHIAGLVALLLQKNGTLTVAAVKTALNNAIRARPSIYPNLQECYVPVPLPQPQATANEAGSGKPDAKTTWNNV